MKSSWKPSPLPFERKKPKTAIQHVVQHRQGTAFTSLLHLCRFGFLLFRLRFRRMRATEKAIVVREFLERRGGLWVKVGQTLATRHDVLPTEYCREFGSLFDGATGIPWEQAQAIIERSLGCSIDETFEEFITQTVAAASIALTYKARLKSNGTLVAVKVRRPHIEDIFLRDLRLIGIVARVLNKFKQFRHLHLLDMHSELEHMFTEELDFRVESTLIRDMRKNLRSHDIYVPKVYSRYCSQEVLVMTFVEGVLMSEYLQSMTQDPLATLRWQSENKIKPRKVAKKMYLSCLRQIYEDNLFHSDLHPGNIMLLKKGRIALLDFGSVGVLDLNTRKQLVLYHRLMAEGDISKAMVMLTHMSSPVPSVGLGSVIRQLVRVTHKSQRFMTVKELPYEERVYNDASSQQLRILGKARIPVGWDFLRAERTFAVLEMSLRQLDPKLDPNSLSQQYFQAKANREEEANGSRAERLLSKVEAITDYAETVLRDSSNAKSVAGKIWGIDLDATKPFKGVLLVCMLAVMGIFVLTLRIVP